MKKTTITIVAMFAFAGCAGIGMSKDLQKETARATGEPLDTIDVTRIGRDYRGNASIMWEAITANDRYSCSANSELRDTHCIKQ